MWWKTARTRLDLSQRGKIMGILNVTPDSFSTADTMRRGLPDGPSASPAML